ncbi:MAG: hypothetical protein RR877_10165 [Aurantimicrobium sp.]|uniref:hypothetical protein n=1 Tax=Aurantimicrobium sp. TaxID=1930784 RepID=UPI002FC64CFE
MRKIGSWAMTICCLPLLFIVYLCHRFIELVFGGMDIVAEGFDRAANLINKLPGGLD